MFSFGRGYVLIVAAWFQLTSSASMMPDELPVSSEPTMEINRDGVDDVPDDVPDECKDQNFCTIKPPDYPQDEFDDLFQGSSRVVKPPSQVPPNESEMDNRQSSADGDDDCRATVTYEPLYRVRSKRGDWRVVINSVKHDYIQRVRLETCVKPMSSCFLRFGEIPSTETFCRQHYTDWQVVVSNRRGGMETITTSLPVCCSCQFRSVDR